MEKNERKRPKEKEKVWKRERKSEKKDIKCSVYVTLQNFIKALMTPYSSFLSRYVT